MSVLIQESERSCRCVLGESCILEIFRQWVIFFHNISRKSVNLLFLLITCRIFNTVLTYFYFTFILGSNGSRGRPGAPGARGRPGAQGPQGPRGSKGMLGTRTQLISDCTRVLFNNVVLPVSLYGGNCKYHRCNNGKLRPGNVMATCVEYCRFDPMSGQTLEYKFEPMNGFFSSKQMLIKWVRAQ